MGSISKGTGCNAHDDCLTCPFDKCLLEDKGGLQRYEKEHRDERIRQLCRIFTIDTVAEHFGISRRTVWRAQRSG